MRKKQWIGEEMITIILSERDFDYEIQALVNSFFPGEHSRILIRQEIDTADLSEHSEEDADVMYVSGLVIRISMSRKEIMIAVECRSVKWERSVAVTGTEDWHKREKKLAHPYRTYYKNELKKLLFSLLRDYPEESLPSGLTRNIPAWGTMTGVRPTKIAMNALLSVISGRKGGQQTSTSFKEQERQQLSAFIAKQEKQQLSASWEERVRQSLQREYLCSPQKADLAVRIVSKEYQLLKQLSYENAYSLYIGIPFCPSTCLYCSFPSYSLEQFGHLTGDYLQALKRELSAVAEVMAGRPVSAVYIGGGTPTTLSAKQLEELLSHVRQQYPLSDACEFTVEAGRPDSICREQLQVLREMGVDRISVNPQTMQQKTLDLIGRRHSVTQTKEAFCLARDLGFSNINMDLIAGLPGEETEDFQDTLRQIHELDPDSITIHSLVIKRASRLRSILEEQAAIGRISIEELERHRGEQMEQMLELGQDFAQHYGYEPYYMYRQKNSAGHAGSSGQENIGFARKGRECLYNILIMEEIQTIVAVGAGASTKLYHPELGQVSRVENVKNVVDYINRVEEMIERKYQLLQDCKEGQFGVR